MGNLESRNWKNYTFQANTSYLNTSPDDFKNLRCNTIAKRVVFYEFN